MCGCPPRPGGVFRYDRATRMPCPGRARSRPRPWAGRLLEVESFAIDFLSAPHCSLADSGQGRRSRPEGTRGPEAQRSGAEDRAPLRAGRSEQLGGAKTESVSGRFLVNLSCRATGDTAGRSPGPKGWAGHAGRPDAGHLFAPREGAWWGAATARRVQSLSRPRHRGGSHAVTRTRALAVPDPAHPASPARSRQRILPSRRP